MKETMEFKTQIYRIRRETIYNLKNMNNPVNIRRKAMDSIKLFKKVTDMISTIFLYGKSFSLLQRL
jgi:hypothetical protein